MPNDCVSSAVLRHCLRGGFLFTALCGFLGLTSHPVAFASTLPASAKPLQIYFVDVEGGQATLFVTPEGKSLLIDTGWPGYNGRDADRIVSAAKLAGITKIDFLLLTHYHQDHAGGVTQLAARIPVGRFIDHGENREPSGSVAGQTFRDYQDFLAKEHLKRTIAKPGDELPIAGMEAKVVSGDGEVLEKPLPGAGEANPTCSISAPSPADHTENARSLGVLFTFGKLRILDLGDLTSDKERQLMCPVNKLGTIDILVVSHHGSLTSTSPELLMGIAPRVAIMDNGATKGGAPLSWDTVKKSPRLEDLWQLHYSNEGGAAHNVADTFIANLSGTSDAGNYLKLTASPDGSFDVYNARTHAAKHYAAGAGN
ncbi:MAG TPA: MBL fold metallo-hydrolase [Candidatus Acidoferrum sp.]|nr:MBL fold metallo-hydrolase [Candidatus Acidoferrum sp.]